jgi:membrane fusion protein (multidrug efflux system)
VVGSLEAEVNATISAQVGGYLLTQDYKEGSLVTNGQVLFQIDDRTYKAALDQAEAKVIKTSQDVARYTPLAKTQAISQQELDDAIQSNAAAVAAAEQARLNYQFCKILSPIDGVAGLVQAQVGNLVGPSSGALTTVTKADPIRVYFSVAQQFMTQLMEKRLAEGKEIGPDKGAGTPLELILASGTVYSLKGQLRFSDNQIDMKTGTIRMVGEFPNPQRLLIPGMFVSVRAQLGVDHDALLVPQRAVADLQGRNLVAVVGADNKVSIRPVKTGTQVGELWVVKGDLKPGDKIVAEGIQKVREGLEVTPKPFAEKPVTTLTP